MEMEMECVYKQVPIDSILSGKEIKTPLLACCNAMYSIITEPLSKLPETICHSHRKTFPGEACPHTPPPPTRTPEYHALHTPHHLL